ncbi:MAG: Hsp70 family protein [Sphingomonas sp.]|uniref:Hsp70 family protein n=1 Tax=Sphingomonas sp. TaxID=28214 RepID=UPI001ACEDD78|nr:Hsp70 family protein [Sphingomonas sp.]MBN8807822.1 Hsp70 family protein [Sphingomonas sp.]
MEYVGIDLGTTNSAIASYDGENVALYKSPEQHDVTPSAIFIDRRGNKFVGSRAYTNAARNPDNAATLFKRMMGTNTPIQLPAVDKVMTPEECSAEVLRTVFGYLPETMRRDGDTGTVITVPAAFNQMQKDATLAAAESAGIGRVALMQEPVAAVMSVMRQRNRDGTFLVFDLGGGTLDIAIAQSMKGRVSLLAHGGVEMCGGREIDRALMNEVVKPWLVDTFDLSDDFVADKRFRSLTRLATWAAERAKIELSRSDEAVIALSETEIGVRDNADEEIYLDIPIDRSQLDRLIDPILEQAIKAARASLDQAGISAHDVDRVVFVGGPTQYKPLRDRVAFELGIAASTDVNPMTAVAEGAAIFAESIDWSTQSRGRKAARSSLSSTGLEFAYVARTPDASARIVAKKVGTANGEFQVDSLDTGWSSGRKELKDGATIDLPLAKPGENAFRVFVFDAGGGPIGIANDRIIISRTAASIDAIPASHTISIEVLEGRGGAKGLEPLVRAGDPLPKKGVVTFRSGEALRAGSPGALNFKLWEGDIREPVEDNMPIGTFRVSGSDFDEGMISIGSEIRCEYEITDGGTIRLDVSVPEIGGSFTSGHNYYARQDAQLDYAQAAGLVAVEAQSTMSRLDEFSKHIDDPRVEAIMDRIEKASSLDVDRAEPEETKHALDEIRAARRDISNVRKDHLKVIRQLDLDGIVSSFDGWGREFALPEEAAAFDALVRTAQHSIDAGASDFETHLAELRSKNIAALWRSDEFVVERFHWLSRSPEQFMDQNRYAALIQQGRAALAQTDLGSLRDILIHLDDLRFTRGGEEEMLAMTNIMRG